MTKAHKFVQLKEMTMALDDASEEIWTNSWDRLTLKRKLDFYLMGLEGVDIAELRAQHTAEERLAEREAQRSWEENWSLGGRRPRSVLIFLALYEWCVIARFRTLDPDFRWSYCVYTTQDIVKWESLVFGFCVLYSNGILENTRWYGGTTKDFGFRARASTIIFT